VSHTSADAAVASAGAADVATVRVDQDIKSVSIKLETKSKLAELFVVKRLFLLRPFPSLFSTTSYHDHHRGHCPARQFQLFFRLTET
jgi:hypothetical protein